MSPDFADEAQCYVAENLHLWKETEGALDFVE